MGSIIKKKNKGHFYYYYVESQRINGKPKYVNQVYLGSAEKIRDWALADKSVPKPISSKIFDFADVAILYNLAERLGLLQLLNACFPKKSQGLSLGGYILIAAINRVVDPVSKSNLGTWYSKTILTRLFNVPNDALSPQNYWNNMNLIKDADIEKFEEQFVRMAVNQYGINTGHLIYDATNFFTYIDTKQDSELAKRGHSKEKRNDLKIVGLSMMISPDCNFPLIYDTYPGNQNDAIEFGKMVQKTQERIGKLFNKKTDVTIVFDRGNNSKKNIDFLEADPYQYYYVGGLKNNQCEHLFQIPFDRFEKMDANLFENTWAYRTEEFMFERKVTVVVTYNENLFNGQMQGISQNIEKTKEKLSEIQTNLQQRSDGTIKKGKKPTKATIKKRIQKILSTEYMNMLFTYEITESEGSILITYSFEEDKLKILQETKLGKTILFSNRFSWSAAEIIGAYRSAWHIEHAFKQLKNPEHLAVRPIFHWTDQKIKVHIFYCVLAFRMCGLLKNELEKKGIQLSVDKIFDELSTIKEIQCIFDTHSNSISHVLSECSLIAKSIADIYDLKGLFLPVG